MHPILSQEDSDWIHSQILPRFKATTLLNSNFNRRFEVLVHPHNGQTVQVVVPQGSKPGTRLQIKLSS